MSVERPNSVIFANHPMTLVGPELKAGDLAPDAQCIGPDLNPLHVLSALPAKIKIISSVPSLDTGVCSAQTHRFEEEVAKLGGQVGLVTLSMDLPFAQGRFCSGAPKEHTIFLSDYRTASFGLAYGTLIKEVRLLSRAVFVVGPFGRILYAQYVKETGTHPDYEAVLKVVQPALG